MTRRQIRRYLGKDVKLAEKAFAKWLFRTSKRLAR